uniref:Uncharacterized protein n=1 Tax=viral metagenome TaxID=1070528 RepID=A0A6C0B831_9ZZZZ
MNGGGGDKKVIQINTDLFKFTSNTTRKNAALKKDPKPIKIKSVNRDKTIKRDMLRRIRANQAEQYNKIFGDKEEPIRMTIEEKFDSGFNDTMEFMNKLVDKQKREQVMPVHNQTLRAPPQNVVRPAQLIASHPMASQPMASHPIGGSHQPMVLQQPHPMVSQQPHPMVSQQPFVQTSQQPMVLQQPMVQVGGLTHINAPKIVHPEPPKFGCLKNGSLPTFRTNKTVRSEPSPLEPVLSGGKGHLESGQGKKLDTAIERIRARLNERATRQENNANFKMPKSKPNKLIRRTHHLGKDKFRPTVGVLLPNRTIRNKVTNKSFMLKNTPIEEIRKYLLKQGFIKVGSASPNDVLRKMYESIIMIDGEIKNYNPDNLLYNFFNDKS